MPQLFLPLFLLLSLVFIKSNFSSLASRLSPFTNFTPSGLPPLRLLAGSGLGTHLLFLPPIPFPEPIHNIFLILFFEIGLLGLILIFCFSKYYLQNLSASGGNLSASGGYNMLAWLAVLLTGLLDHYWLTSHQNQLLICLLVAFTIKQSIHRQIS